MRISRPCYDKPWRCPGWAGGGTKGVKEFKCPNGGSVASQWQDQSAPQWRFHRCSQCKVFVLPLVIKYLDPGYWRWIYWDILDLVRHYRTHVGMNRIHAVFRALYYTVRGKEPWV